MKVIDLYVKIANGKEVPKKVKYKDEIYEYHESVHDYYCHSVAYLFDRIENLNDEVEIIEEIIDKIIGE